MSRFSAFVYDYLWPLIEYEEVEPKESLDTIIERFKERLLKINDSEIIRETFNFAKQIANSEKERCDYIVKKVALIFASSGLISAIIFGSAKYLETISSYKILSILILLLVIITLIYLFMAMFYCIKVISIGSFYILSADDIIRDDIDNINEYLKAVTSKLLDYTERNYRITNNIIDSYLLALAFFRNSIFLIVIIGACVAASTIYKCFII